jgi:hypothetical protein
MNERFIKDDDLTKFEKWAFSIVLFCLTVTLCIAGWWLFNG